MLFFSQSSLQLLAFPRCVDKLKDKVETFSDDWAQGKIVNEKKINENNQFAVKGAENYTNNFERVSNILSFCQPLWNLEINLFWYIVDS